MRVSSTTTIPASATIVLSPLTNPSTIVTDYTTVFSFTADSYLISESRDTIQFSTFCTFPCRECPSSSRSVCLSCYPASSNLTNRIYLFQSQCVATCPSGYIAENITHTCSPCVLPCYECSGVVNYCTSCVPNSTFVYLNRTDTTSTCLSSCPVYMYADLTQVPALCVNCVSPCSKCTTISICQTCVASYYLYGTSCLASCPANTTVLINDTCYNCSAACLQCSVTVTNCTACAASKFLYAGACYSTCPGNLIPIGSSCVSCDTSCRTCSVTVTNCSSCFTNSSLSYYYGHMCLGACPDFYYSDSFFVCQSCDSLNMGCKNCSSPTACLSCDSGFVLLSLRCLNQTPAGYLNISGVAVACEGDCATCSLTLTNCTSCRTLNLYDNTCQQECPTGTVALNRVCQLCTYPCLTCTNISTVCNSCYSNSSLYLLNNQCVNASSCPAFTYADTITLSCLSCVSPCSLCRGSSTCTTCVAGFFFVNSTSTCETSCPPYSIGINRLCVACLSPCRNCTSSISKCMSCVDGFYYNGRNYECLTTCPSGLVNNDTTMQCDPCSSPCKTCANTTDTCLSCVAGTFLSNAVCVTQCPAGQYGSSGLCKAC